MARSAASDGSSAEKIIADIFVHPPVNEAELAARLAAVRTQRARRLVVDRLAEHALPDRAGPLFLAVLKHLGVGREGGRLKRLALGLDNPPRDRLWAAMALTVENPGVMDELMADLGADGMDILAGLCLLELLAMQEPEAIGESIANALDDLGGLKPEGQILAQIESARIDLGASCAAAYGPALHRSTLDGLHGPILELFIEEASEEGALFLERLRDGIPPAQDRRAIQAALLKLRSARIDPARPLCREGGRAAVSNCDGQGNFIVLGVLARSDGTNAVAELNLRAGFGIIDGIVYPRRTSQEVRDLVESISLRLGCAFVDAPFQDAADVVLDCRRRMPADTALSPRVRSALGLFAEEPSAVPRRPGGGRKPRSRVSLAAVKRLLARPEYEDAWLLDLGDLGLVPGKPPARGRAARGAWFAAAAEALLSSPVPGRLRAMCEHMSRWHGWRGDREQTAMLAALARETTADFCGSPLVRAILERSIEVLDDAPAEVAHRFGDAALRQHLKRLFFEGVDHPKGADLARLDLAETACLALSDAFALLPAERRPTNRERDVAAYAVGRYLADGFAAGDPPPLESTADEAARALTRACRLNAGERHQVVMRIVPALYAFIDEICGSCGTCCRTSWTSDASSAFFDTSHPRFAPHRGESASER